MSFTDILGAFLSGLIVFCWAVAPCSWVIWLNMVAIFPKTKTLSIRRQIAISVITFAVLFQLSAWVTPILKQWF